jgi:hypothetical protein
MIAGKEDKGEDMDLYLYEDKNGADYKEKNGMERAGKVSD